MIKGKNHGKGVKFHYNLRRITMRFYKYLVFLKKTMDACAALGLVSELLGIGFNCQKLYILYAPVFVFFYSTLISTPNRSLQLH